MCKFGTSCKFLHNDNSSAKESKSKKKRKRDDNQVDQVELTASNHLVSTRKSKPNKTEVDPQASRQQAPTRKPAPPKKRGGKAGKAKPPMHNPRATDATLYSLYVQGTTGVFARHLGSLLAGKHKTALTTKTDCKNPSHFIGTWSACQQWLSSVSNQKYKCSFSHASAPITFLISCMSSLVSLGRSYDPGEPLKWLTSEMQKNLKLPLGEICMNHKDATNGILGKNYTLTALPVCVLLSDTLTPLSRLLFFYSFLEGLHECATTQHRKPKVSTLNVFANLREGLCPQIQFLDHTMNLGEGPAIAADHKEFINGLLEIIYTFFPLLLEELASVVSRQQKEFQKQWTESEIAIEFLNSLRELCKSKNMEETDSRLSTCFDKLLNLLDYIRPYHFVVGVKTGHSFDEVLTSDTTFMLKDGTLIQARANVHGKDPSPP
jgi:hypothetical protein